jgi:CDP-diacylglycerol--glycerol-3-phosphate 3-phosphatidyltransferase
VISERIGYWVRGYVLTLGHALAKVGFTANMLTVIGLLLNIGVAVVIAADHPRWGGALLLVASAFDMLDGAVARATQTMTRFGGFLDSTLDRYSEVVVYLGLMIYFFQTDDDTIGPLLIFISAAGALLISYARARAEAAGFKASVGLVARPERVILLAICLVFGRPLWALWVLAFATHITALTRIVHVWRLSLREPSATPPVAPVGAVASVRPRASERTGERRSSRKRK